MQWLEIRKARLEDVPGIAELVNNYANQGLMLSKRQVDLYEQVREFVVVVTSAQQLLGCGALRLVWHNLAEVRSLAIAEVAKGTGLGRRIVDELLKEASQLGLAKVFALTYQVDFFEKLGFHVVDKSGFPQKVWLDCNLCPKQTCCDEVAVLRILNPNATNVDPPELVKEWTSGKEILQLRVIPAEVAR
ncbi:N-acetyltransferase [bacterium]|nr:N-acetyltransferase [bacterium]